MKKRAGYFKVASIRGVPVSVHWSLPAGGVLVSVFGHVDPRQWAYYCMAYIFLVIIHELGHVFAAFTFQLKILSVEISGVGGLCRIERPREVRQSAFVYSAGLLAQAALFTLALGYIQVFGAPTSTWARACIITFTFVNLGLFVINLIPHRNARSGLATDGSVLWRLLLHVLRGHPHPHPPLVATPPDQAPMFPPDTRLLEKAGFRPPGFVHGVEILNDRTTPMEFVVSALIDHLGLTRDQAIVKMLDIHNTGGMLIALPSEQEARKVADEISGKALSSGHSFICRYAGAQGVPADRARPTGSSSG